MRSSHGVAALEFAIILPIFALLLFGIMDYGWLFYHYAAMDAAANTGCRAGALTDPGMGEVDMAAVEDRANEAVEDALGGLGIHCERELFHLCHTTTAAFGVNPGRSIHCTLRYDFDPLVGLYLDPFTMQSDQITRLEYQR
jgi:hypothetical protein